MLEHRWDAKGDKRLSQIPISVLTLFQSLMFSPSAEYRQIGEANPEGTWWTTRFQNICGEFVSDIVVIRMLLQPVSLPPAEWPKAPILFFDAP